MLLVHFGDWGTQTIVSGLGCDGLIAPWVLNGPINRAAFDAYIETHLAPELRPGDVVILDSPLSHKCPCATELLKAKAAWVPLRTPGADGRHQKLSAIVIQSR